MDWQPISDTTQTLAFNCAAVEVETETSVDDMMLIEVSVIDGSLTLSDRGADMGTVNFEAYAKLGSTSFVATCSSDSSHAANIARVVTLEMLERGVAIDERTVTDELRRALEVM